MRSIVVAALVAVPALSISPVVGTPPSAQESSVRVAVRDTSGGILPYALVQVVNGATRTADDSGRVTLPVAAGDSLRLVVRRIGFSAFEGWVLPSAAGVHEVRLAPLPHSLRATRIIASSNELLGRTGFYDRMERARRGASAARFITPEQIDLRNPSKISQMLFGEAIIKPKYDRGRVMLLGRTGSCPYAVVLDGHKVRGLIQEYYTREGQMEIDRRSKEMRGGRRVGSVQAAEDFLKERQSVDDLVIASGVVAIEIYPSIAAAPAELLRSTNSDDCGMVVLWTGSRG